MGGMDFPRINRARCWPRIPPTVSFRRRSWRRPGRTTTHCSAGVPWVTTRCIRRLIIHTWPRRIRARVQTQRPVRVIPPVGAIRVRRVVGVLTAEGAVAVAAVVSEPLGGEVRPSGSALAGDVLGGWEIFREEATRTLPLRRGREEATRTLPLRRGREEAKGTLPSHALSQGDEDVATPFPVLKRGSVELPPRMDGDFGGGNGVCW